MANYMTQIARSGLLPNITYYRKQTGPRLKPNERRTFEDAAKRAYAAAKHIQVGAVELGTFGMNQGVPTGGDTEKI